MNFPFRLFRKNLDKANFARKSQADVFVDLLFLLVFCLPRKIREESPFVQANWQADGEKFLLSKIH